MNEKLDAELCSAYPKLFANRYADMQTTAMFFNHTFSKVRKNLNWINLYIN